MADSCGGSIIKIILFVFNFIWLALSCAIIYLGIRVLLKYNTDISDIIKETPSYAAIVLIAGGGVIFLISFLGCCGAFKESYCMLNTYAGLILLALIAQGVGAYMALKYHYDLEKYAEQGIDSALQAYDWRKPPTDHTNKAIEQFQRQLQCCGARNRSDWDAIVPDLDKGLYPESCCKDLKDADVRGRCPADKTWPNGCVQSIKDYLNITTGSLGYIAISIGLIELLILISACCLARDIRNKYEPYATPKPARA